MTQYWIAHAKVDNRPVHELCRKHGIWFANAETTQGRLEQIKKGDGIALKTGGRIIATGIVVDTTSLKPYRLVFVEWTSCDKKAPRGLRETLYGPYAESNEYVKAIWGSKV
jgi:hypothetical protein